MRVAMRHCKLLGPILLLLVKGPSIHADPPSSAKQEPFLLRMGVFAPMSSKCGWTLTVDGGGLAQLSIAVYPTPKKRTFHISAKQRVQFRKVVTEQKIFALDAEYGDAVPDSSERTLTLKQGQQTKSIELRFLRLKDPRLPEVKRVLIVWNMAQSWFHDPAALDLRPYEKDIMAAHPKFDARTNQER